MHQFQFIAALCFMVFYFRIDVFANSYILNCVSVCTNFYIRMYKRLHTYA